MWSTKTRLKNSFETLSHTPCFDIFHYLSYWPNFAPQTYSFRHVFLKKFQWLSLAALDFDYTSKFQSIWCNEIHNFKDKTSLSENDKSIVVLTISLECLLLLLWRSFITCISIHKSSTCPILYSVFLLTCFGLWGHVQYQTIRVPPYDLQILVLLLWTLLLNNLLHQWVHTLCNCILRQLS